MLAGIIGGTVGALIVVLLLWRSGVICLIKLARFHGRTGKQILALSFDDGPDWGEEQLIQALNKAKIEATFFWLWEKVEKLKAQDPDRFARLLQSLRQGGHEVGNHGLKCTIQPRCVCKRILGFTSSDIYSDLIQAQQKFHDLLGYEPHLYRPHGFQLGREMSEAIVNSRVKFVVGSMGLAIGPDRKNVGKKYQKKFARARQGDIICGHDSRDCETDFGLASDIARVVPRLQEIMARKKLHVRKISQVLR